MPTVHLLDYVAGNIRSLVNALNKLDCQVEWIKTPEDVKEADVCIMCYFNSALDLLIIFCGGCIGLNFTRSWPFWSLYEPACKRRVPRTYQGAYKFWKAIYGHMCWPPGFVSNV